MAISGSGAVQTVRGLQPKTTLSGSENLLFRRR